MKKSFLFLILILAFSLISCDKQDNEPIAAPYSEGYQLAKTTSKVTQAGKGNGSDKVALVADLQVLISPINLGGTYPNIFAFGQYYEYPYFSLPILNTGTDWQNNGSEVTADFFKAQIFDAGGNILSEIAPPAPISSLVAGGYMEVYPWVRDIGTTFPISLPNGDYRFLLTIDPLNQWNNFKQYYLDFNIAGTFHGFKVLTIQGGGWLQPVNGARFTVHGKK